ncbi:MAG: GNAT family N-acetyltransferase [Betaproteobacteria bacterium]|nr:GNAT family N-acetyltransferase [Betaproteobacteria bacterium]
MAPESLSEALCDAWRRLHAAHCGHEAVCSGPDFFATLVETQPEDRLTVAVGYCGDNSAAVCALAPLRMRIQAFDPHGLSAYLLRRPMRIWAVLGSDPLLDPHSPAAHMLPGFLCGLEQAPGKFDALELQALEVASPTWNAIMHSGDVRKRFFVYTPNGIRNCHQTPLPDTHETYLAQFPRKKRYNLARQLRLIAENLGGLPEVVPHADTASIDALIDAVKRIGGSERLLLSKAEYAALGKKGLLLNFVVRVGDEPIAVILGIPSGSIYRLNKLIYTQRLAPYSPGTSTLHMMNEWFIADGRFKLVDFGFGEPARTYSSSNRTVRRARVLLLRRTFGNRMLLMVHRGIVALEMTGRKIAQRSRIFVDSIQSKKKDP